ncbi:helix-turn-helix domain-containing protein [Aeromonas veronii]|uniref:winged helix-turn-helix domain-containing protein n=1 Tax=Aeromonas veronii TaxID=654 RepID=UPI00226D03D5|nr:helix-turn-helix domain-containing protein [Aeromonas veronii]MCX9134851.1 helix-turn-helix domain-containing protein [Aeromonas veronii]
MSYIMINKKKAVTFDLHSGIVEYVTSNGAIQRSRLGKKERHLLLFLIENQNKIVSKENILESVWHDRVVCENTASVTLSNIRKFLKKADEDCACLTTISGSGYVFIPSKSGFILE